MTEQPSVVACLSTAMEQIRSVGKTGKNQSQGYSFRGIDATVNAASPAFRAVGVVVMPELRSIDYETVEVGNKRSLMQSCKVVVAYTFHGPAGDAITAVAPGEAMDSGDKATAKAMSVAFRIALLQALCIPTDEQDPDEHSYERSPRQAGISAAQAKQQLLDHLAGKVPGSVKDHAAAVWTEAAPVTPLDDDGLARLIAVADEYVADEYVADLAAIGGEPKQEALTDA
jgi:hypothetical protein